MLICAPSCVSANKPVVGLFNGCGNKRAPGGIPRLLFLICDPTYVHPYSVAEGVSPWSDLRNITAAMCAGILNFSGPVLGEMPKPTATKKKMSSCDPEEVTGGSTVINFQDYNVTDDQGEYEFHDWIKNNYRYLKFGWVTCDDLLFMYQGGFVPEIGPVIENSNEGNRYVDGSITMATYDMIIPVKVEGLLDLLSNFNPADCYS